MQSGLIGSGGKRFPSSLLVVILLACLAAGCASVATRPVPKPSGAGAPPPEATTPRAPASAAPVEPRPGQAEAAEGQLVAEDAVPAEEQDTPEEEAEKVPSPIDDLAVTPPEPAPEQLEKELKLVEEEAPAFDIPMIVNEKVVTWLDYYTGRHRERFEAGLVRSGRYLSMIHRVFEQAGLPKDLAYMAHVESAYKYRAYSRAGAKGIFQFIAATGRRYGLKRDAWVDERSDPEKATRAAAAYLQDLYAEFGDWYLALAAYNAGEGKIRRGLRSTGAGDFWELARTRAIRTETKNYVPAILAATLISKDPAKYGFKFDPDAPLAYDTIEVRGAVDLRVLARCAGTDLETLKELNPALRRSQTPPGRTTGIRVPSGTSAETLTALAKVPQSERVLSHRHIVRKGETLSTIARRYGTSVASIQQANRLGRKTLLRAGRELVIPTWAGRGYPAAALEADGVPDEPRSQTSYRVKKGDTLSSIARRFHTTSQAIAAASGIRVGHVLHVGTRLKIPGSASAGGANGSAPMTHTVRRGESLWGIAARYKTSIEHLCALNSISRDETLVPGTRLTIRTD